LTRPEPPSRFDEPWQAQAFALTVCLAETGVFSWPDWTGALSGAIAGIEARGEAIDEGRYFEAWLTALETLTVGHHLLAADALAGRVQAWRDAYEHTPHGSPVVLGPGSAA
jgi:nitrile hydratase accessory protein